MKNSIYILGLQLGHNASVCLLKDGEIVSAVSQEKFDNIKNSFSFPKEAIEWILKENDLSPKDIKYIANSGALVYPDMILASFTPMNIKVNKFNISGIYSFLSYKFYKHFPWLFIFIDKQKSLYKTKKGKLLLEKKIKGIRF